MNVSPFIKYSTYQIAKGLAPYDTGNLRQNAIRLRNVKPNSWTITYDTSRATYIEPLEEGSKYMEGRHFIRLTANTIAVYLKNTLEGKRTSLYHKNLMRKSLDTANEADKLRRENRRIESLMRYDIVKDKFKTYNSETIGVKL